MVYTNAERQRLFRKRKQTSDHYEELKSKEAHRLKRLCNEQKEKEKELSIYKQRTLFETRRQKNRERVMKHRMRKRDGSHKLKKKSPFKSVMAYAKATSRVKRALPETPRRSKIICKQDCPRTVCHNLPNLT